MKLKTQRFTFQGLCLQDHTTLKSEQFEHLIIAQASVNDYPSVLLTTCCSDGFPTLTYRGKGTLAMKNESKFRPCQQFVQLVTSEPSCSNANFQSYSICNCEFAVDIQKRKKKTLFPNHFANPRRCSEKRRTLISKVKIRFTAVTILQVQ